MIYIRADGNKTVGMGHIMRCLSIADELRIYSDPPVFILSSNDVEDYIRSRGFPTFVLNSDYKKMEEELDLWPEEKAAAVIVDSYFVSSSYLLSLKHKLSESGKLIYIDDLALFPYPVDLIINYNIYADIPMYSSLYSKCLKNPQLALGPRYAPLRKYFRDVPQKKQARDVRNILISTGGSDEFHLSRSMIQYLCNKKREKKYFHFLLGALNPDKEELRELAGKNENIVLHENVADMRTLISAMDIVVSAAGSTVYEVCCCGVPLITYVIADNQTFGARAMEELLIAVNVGDLRVQIHEETKETDPEKKYILQSSVIKIFDAIDDLAGDWNKRIRIGKKMQDVVDGFGAERIAHMILNNEND